MVVLTVSEKVEPYKKNILSYWQSSLADRRISIGFLASWIARVQSFFVFIPQNVQTINLFHMFAIHMLSPGDSSD